MPISADEKERYSRNRANPYKRFHYRYKASDLMWEAASLLPDNDPLTAEALFLGGTYLKNRDGDAANRFYLALVRRNPNLEIARKADTLRWFPSEFTDKAAYVPVGGISRKKVLGIVGVLGIVALILGVCLYRKAGGRTDPLEKRTSNKNT